jgi:hypothetical protein
MSEFISTTSGPPLVALPVINSRYFIEDNHENMRNLSNEKRDSGDHPIIPSLSRDGNDDLQSGALIYLPPSLPSSSQTQA